MTLSFTALDKEVQLRHFWCELSELEVALDVLSMISAQGDTIVKAQLIDDEGGRTDLPTEAFDGELFTNSMRQLEEQWQDILSEPVSALPENSWYIELTCRRIKIYNDRINQLILTINKFEQFRQRADDAPTNGPRKIKLMGHYNSALSTYHHQIDQARNCRQLIQEKLDQLQK